METEAYYLFFMLFVCAGHWNFTNRQLGDDLNIKLRDQIISQMTMFKYLGSIIRKNGEIDEQNVNYIIQTE